MNLVLDYESSALAAPQSFRDGMQAAANILDSTIQDNITVTILVGYGDWDNGQDTGITTGAEGGDLGGYNETYSAIRAALASHETSSVDQTFVNSLPSTSSVNGVSTMYVPLAIAKTLGFASPNTLEVDGAVGMGTNIPTSLLVGVALHELTHAMGREPWGATFDLLRYTSPGVHLFATGDTAPAAYFSIDGGNTKLADFGQTSDPSDFLNSGVQGSNDAFNEFYSFSTLQSLTSTDIELLDALGFDTTARSIALSGTSAQAVRGGAAVVALSAAPSIVDSTSSTISSATIHVTNTGGSVFPGDQLFVNGQQSGTIDGVTVSWNGSANVLTLTGTASIATYETLLSQVTYQDNDTFADGSSGSHTEHVVTWTVNDGTANITGTTEISVDRAPSVSVSNLALTSGYVSVAASSLLTASDPDADPIATYAFENTGTGRFYLNGVAEPINQEIDVTAAQLPKLVYNNAIGTDTVQVRVSDGTLWSSWGSFTVTGPTATVVQVDGSTTLTEVGTQFWVTGSNGVSHWLSNGVAGFVAGAYGPWSPIGAVQTTTGFDVAWKETGVDLYSIWITDPNATMVSSVSYVTGESYTLQSYESVFGQDLNNDSHIGFTPALISTDSGTYLTEVGNEFFLYNSSNVGPALNTGGVAFTAGAYGPWSPIDAVAIGGGEYDVLWKETGVDLYSIWTTDANGKMLSSVSFVTAESIAFESFETVFGQDLNSDGHIGIPSTVISVDNGTYLTEVGNEFFLYNSSNVGPALNSGGVVFTAGAYGPWSPIDAVAIGGGEYDVLWKETGVDLYSIWTTDANGKMVSSVSFVTAESMAFELFETTFGQDLNGDGHIGPPATVIATDGGTTLTEVGNEFFLYNSSNVGPALNSGGAVFTAGAYGPWSPIDAVAIGGGGYDVLWKETGVDLYSIWTTDANGNMVSSVSYVTAESIAFESFETVFGQDLNSDGHIGIPSTVISVDNGTYLTEVGNEFFLYNSSNVGPALNSGGVAFTAGAYGPWSPIDAVGIGGGEYDVVWKETGADLYSIWTTDSHGNMLSSVSYVTGESYTLQSFENLFGQDLNGDGHVGFTVATGGSLELPGAQSAWVAFLGSTGSLTLDAPQSFTGTISGFSGNGTLAGSDQIDLTNLAYSSAVQSHSSYNSATGMLTVSNGSTTDTLHFAGSYVSANFSFASDGHGGTIVYDPPVTDTPAAAPASTPTEMGSGGGDAFVFPADFGKQTVADFHAAQAAGASHDVLEFAHADFATAADALAAATQIGGDTVIALNAGNTVTLSGVDHNTLHQSDFHIV